MVYSMIRNRAVAPSAVELRRLIPCTQRDRVAVADSESVNQSISDQPRRAWRGHGARGAADVAVARAPLCRATAGRAAVPLPAGGDRPLFRCSSEASPQTDEAWGVVCGVGRPRLNDGRLGSRCSRV